MPEYEFTIRVRLTDATIDMDARLERLAEAGCDDALPGIGRPGGMALAFTRSADSAGDAILGAIADVLSAMPDAQLVGASPDLVGLTDAAAIMGFSRQNMRKLVHGSQESPPAPFHAGAPSLWHLSDLLEWLRLRGYSIDPALAETAVVTMQVNIAVELTRADPAAQREIADVVS